MSEDKEFPVTEELKAFLLKPLLRFEPKAAAPTAKIKVGDKMPDGTIYAGISPDTKKHMYVAPKDASRCLDYYAALDYAKNLKVGGKRGFHVPSEAELELLYRNRKKGALKATFNSEAYPESAYRSTTPYSDRSFTIYLDFRNGKAYVRHLFDKTAVRCIRYGARS